MGVEIDIVYTGDLHCEAKHLPSGNTLVTDAPKDNEGRGEAFSPTDLVATALGACMVTIMGIVARRDGIPLEGTKIRVVKEMASAPVRRIAEVKVAFTVPNGNQISPEQRTKLERAAATCPVFQSLHPDVKKTVSFIYV